MINRNLPMKPHPYYLHSVAQRALQNVRSHLCTGTAAFYLGAGVDKQLASDAGERAPAWDRLLAETNPFPPHVSEDELKVYANDWPMETALSAKLRLGEEEFKNKVTESADHAFIPDLKKIYTKEISSLLLKSNLIVTPNYTSHVLDSLRLFIKKQGLDDKKEIIVLTREDLASFPFPIAEADPNRIFLIHIHGRCVERSSLIFDAWGYNIAVNDDPHYYRFLYNLFSYRSVICIGTSWSDIPIRNQAALVFRTQSYQRPSHISLDHYSSKADLAKHTKPDSARRNWSNAMHAAYGVRLIVTTTEKEIAVLKTLDESEVDLAATPELNDIVGVANFFDSCGDYESPLQQQWLLKVSPSNSPLPASRIKSTVLKLYKCLIDKLKKKSSLWETTARLERHLRHFHYLYVRDENSYHEELWDLLAHKLNSRIWKSIDDEQVRFQFLIGQYELSRPFPSTRSVFVVGNRLYDKRLDLGKYIWKVKDVASTERTASQLLDLGWESMASKLFLDLATITAQNATGSYDPQTSEKILGLAFHGRDIARSTGYFRREVKAETLAAMWLPNPQESRIRILSKMRAAEFYPPSGSITAPKPGAVIEPALVAGLIAGLLASHIRSLDLHSRTAPELDQKLRESISPLLNEAGIKWLDAPKNLLLYWRDLIEGSLRRPFNNALRGEYNT